MLSIDLAPERDFAFGLLFELIEIHTEQLRVDGIDADFNQILINFQNMSI